MANQEIGRRGIFNIGAPPRETPTTTVPKPELTPASSPEQKNKGRKGKKGNPLLRGLLAAGITIAGVGAAYEIPPVHDAVNKAIERVFGKDVPNTFDNSLDKGVIGDNNTKSLPISEIQNLPSFDENGKPIFLFSLVPPAGKTIEYTKKFQGGLVHPGVEVDEKTTRNVMNLKIPAGTILNSPMDGRVFIGIDYNGFKKQDILDINFMGNDGMLYVVIISNEGPENNTFQPQVNAPERSKENSNGKEWEKGLPIAKGQKLATITKNADFSMLIFGGLNGTFYGPKLEGNLQFAVDSSNKLILPQV